MPRPERVARRRARAALAIAILMLATSACGARWSDPQRAEFIARTQGGGSGGRLAAGSGSGGGGTATTTPGGSTNSGSTSGGGTGSGSVTGSGTGEAGSAAVANGPAGPLPCSAASDAPGVTGDTVTVANISSLSGPIPGLGAAAVGAARSYVAYRNSIGGVCGRKIVLKTADDGADNGRFRALVADLAQSSLGFISNNAGGDAGGADVVESMKVPVVATAFNEAFQNVSTVFDMNPPPADVHAVIGKYKYLVDHGVQKASLITLSAEAAVAQLDQQQAQMEAAGIQIVNRQILPLSTLSFDSAARGVANSGADYLFFLSAAQQDASMAQSMRDTGYKLKFEEYLTAYGSNFIDLAGGAANGTTSWIRTLPNEEPHSNAEQELFLQWMAQVAPDVFPDTFAADAWASAKAFFDALEQLSGPITRDALIDQLRTYTSFDAGGLEGTINLGGKVSNGCFIAMIVDAGVWKRLVPDQGFLC